MEAVSIIENWKRRLVAMADNPPYVFCDTSQKLREEYYRKLTNFVGYSEAEVACVEKGLGVRFPAVFRAYLREMGKSPGRLFRGSDLAGIEDFEQFRMDALSLMAESNPGPSLPPEAIVFLFHQGYMFVYLVAMGGFDSPVWQYTETEEPREIAPTFADMVDSELRLMESNDAAAREMADTT